MKHDLILRVGAKLFMPFILLFALYVQFHGELGPGGGFQAGVITAGDGHPLRDHLRPRGRAAHRARPAGRGMMPLGVLIYAGIGLVGLSLGGNYLDYFVLAHDPAHGQELGIFLVEVGVPSRSPG